MPFGGGNLLHYITQNSRPPWDRVAFQVSLVIRVIEAMGEPVRLGIHRIRRNIRKWGRHRVIVPVLRLF